MTQSRYKPTKMNESSGKILDHTIAERVAYLRKARELSQIDLAKAAGISQATVAQIERGKKDPSVTTLKKLAVALNVTPALLFATDDIHVFDMVRLRKKYRSLNELHPTLYKALDQVVRYAKDIGFT